MQATLALGHQRNKPGAAKASLRLVLGGGTSAKPGAKPPAMVGLYMLNPV